MIMAVQAVLIILVLSSLPACTILQKPVLAPNEPVLPGNSPVSTDQPPEPENTSTPPAPEPETPPPTIIVSPPASPSPSASISPTPERPDPLPALTPGFKMVGYITHWYLNRLPHIRVEMLTHLIWQGVEVTSGTDPALRVSNNAGWDQIPRVVAAAHGKGVKVLVSLVGPWNVSDLTRIWESPTARARLVENLKNLVETYNLDGIDVDNENICSPAAYAVFLEELYKSLAPLGKIISLAANPSRVCLYPDTAKYLDFINLMTYDMAKGVGYPYHSTLEESVKAMNLWVNAGIPQDKLLMGIPFYGRDSGTKGFEYWWIVDKYRPLPSQNQVSEPLAAGGIIWWNGIELVKQKVDYIRNSSFGGVMVYEVSIDKFDDQSLLKAVFDELARSSHTAAGTKGK